MLPALASIKEHFVQRIDGKGKAVLINLSKDNRLCKTRLGNSEYVFPRKKDVNQPISGDHFQDAWERARAASGIEKDFRESHNVSFHFHDLRHTFASWHVMSGTNVYTVMKLLAHSNIRETQRYAHLSPEYLQDDSAAAQLAHQARVASLDVLFTEFFPTHATNADQSMEAVTSRPNHKMT